MSSWHAKADQGWEGKTIADRYVVGRKLGSGAMANVHQALDKRLDRVVAIKILRSDNEHGKDYAKRLFREAKSAAKVTHHNTIAIFDVGQTGETVYVVMELLEGRPLNELLRDEKMLPPVFVMDAARQTAEALTAIHRAGIVHRDIKPENLFVVDSSSGASLKLLDFSIAKLSAEQESQQLTMEGAVIGSAYYMAPEQVRALPVSSKTDLYALGCVIYECITGRPPYTAGTLVDLWAKHLTAPPPRIENAVAGVPLDLSDLVVQMMAKDPEHRPPSAAAVAHRLGELIELGLGRGMTSKGRPRGVTRTEKYATERHPGPIDQPTETPKDIAERTTRKMRKD